MDGDVLPVDAAVAAVVGPAVGRAPGGRADEARLAWEDDLDVASAPVLASALRVLGDLGVPSVALDVSAVTFMDCGGLGALLDADARLEGGLRLVRPSRAVLRLLSLVGLTGRFDTTDVPVPTTCVPGTLPAIEQSLGLVMGSYGCTADQAWTMLRRTAELENVQVRVLAALLVAVASVDVDHSGGGTARAVQRVMRSTHPTA